MALVRLGTRAVALRSSDRDDCGDREDDGEGMAGASAVGSDCAVECSSAGGRKELDKFSATEVVPDDHGW